MLSHQRLAGGDGAAAGRRATRALCADRAAQTGVRLDCGVIGAASEGGSRVRDEWVARRPACYRREPRRAEGSRAETIRDWRWSRGGEEAEGGVVKPGYVCGHYKDGRRRMGRTRSTEDIKPNLCR